MFKVLLFNPIFNLMIGLYKLFGENLGFAIIAIAIFSRLITIPILAKQLKSTQKIAELKPKLDKLKEKYKDNKEKYNEETLKLYQEMGVNPIGGCLPMIIQLIFLVQVRNVVVALVNEGVASFNEIAYFSFLKFSDNYQVNLNFLGIDLNKVASDFSWSDYHIIPYVILALAVGLTQYFSSKIMTPQIASADKTSKEINTAGKQENAASFEEMSKQMTNQMLFLFPIMTTFMALGYTGSSYFSASLSLFWTVQNLFVIIQKVFVKSPLKQSLSEKFSKIFVKKGSLSKNKKK